MHLASFSILLIQVVAYALPAASLSISISPRVEAPSSKQLKPEKVKLDGNTYTATPLSYEDQGQFSHAFRIEGGYRVDGKLIPAILKRVFEKKGSDNPNSKTLKEIEILKRSSVNLHLYSVWRKTEAPDLPYQIDIVVKDLRGMDPPYKTFYEWYPENKYIQALGGLFNARENIKERLMWYVQHENLLYNDFHMRNIFLQEQAILMRALAGTSGRYMEDNVVIMPADWGPTDVDVDVGGVEDIADRDNKDELIEKYEEELDDVMFQYFNVEELASSLKDNGHSLRSADIMTTEFKGKTYQLLHIRESDDVNFYSMVGGFDRGKSGAQDVIPAIMSIRDMEDDEGEGEENIQELKDAGMFLASEESNGQLLVVFEDRRNQDADDSESDG